MLSIMLDQRMLLVECFVIRHFTRWFNLRVDPYFFLGIVKRASVKIASHEETHFLRALHLTIPGKNEAILTVYNYFVGGNNFGGVQIALKHTMITENA